MKKTNIYTTRASQSYISFSMRKEKEKKNKVEEWTNKTSWSCQKKKVNYNNKIIIGVLESKISDNYYVKDNV